MDEFIYLMSGNCHLMESDFIKDCYIIIFRIDQMLCPKYFNFFCLFVDLNFTLNDTFSLNLIIVNKIFRSILNI
jgi:hypothetical protein